MQGHGQYRDTENTLIQSIQGYRRIQRYGQYRYTENTGIQRYTIERYRGTGIQRIQGYRKYRYTENTHTSSCAYITTEILLSKILKVYSSVLIHAFRHTDTSTALMQLYYHFIIQGRYSHMHTHTYTHAHMHMHVSMHAANTDTYISAHTYTHTHIPRGTAQENEYIFKNAYTHAVLL